jgi:transposase
LFEQGRSKRASPWLVALLKRKPPKLVAIALANIIARIAWKLMTTGEKYKAIASPVSVAAA